MSLAAILAVVTAPLLVRWAATLANKPSADGATFRPSPPLRAIYPGILIAGFWGLGYFLSEAWEVGFQLIWSDVLGLVGMLALSLTAILSWPPTLWVVQGGLYCQKFASRRFFQWDQIDSADSGMDGELIIYLKDGRQIEVSQFIEGRYQLKSLIREKLKADALPG
jgi:hypothetical protein